MKKFLYIAFASTILFSCQSSEEELEVENPIAKVPEEKVVALPNMVATMEVDGMACVMACGGSIKKALRKTNGVSSIEFDFETGRETNVTTISYNSDIITLEEMKEIVSKINNNQFKIGETSSKRIHENTSTKTSSACPHIAKTPIEATRSSFEIPNLLDILSGLLPG